MVYKKQIDSKKIAIAILFLVFFAKLYFIISQFVDNKYLIAPGGDPVAHLATIQTILDGKFSWHNISYPPLYHFVMALIVKLTGGDILAVMKYGAITLLFICIPIFYYLSKYLFGFWTAFWGTLLFMLVSSNPLLNFVDGSYPDMLNYGVFVPLAFLFLLKSFEKKPFVNLILSLIFIILMIFTHHMTTAFAVLIIVIYLCVVGIYYYFTKDKELKNYKIISLFFLLSGLVIYLLAKISFGPLIDTVIKSLFSGNSFITNTTFSKPPEFSNVSNLYILMPAILEFLGFAGLIYCLASIKHESYKKIFMIVWIIVLWGLSRTDMSGVAPRFLRELSFPLAILSGLIITKIIRLANNNIQKILIGGMIGYLIIINMIQLNMPPFLLPDGFKNMVWYRQIDQEKVDYITSNLPDKSSVISNPFSPYLPYFLSKSNKKIGYEVIRNAPEIDQDNMSDYINSFSADYMLVGHPPMDNIDEKTFSEFVGYQEVTDLLNRYQYPEKDLVKQFLDGSKLIKLKNNDQE